MTAKKTRDSNMELLRIVAMLLIMMIHASNRALPMPDSEDIVANPSSTFLQFTARGFSIMGVDVFVMLSGWYGIRPKLSRICKKHHIKYWLSSGTLIGAMRHNGFIPWDDDLDIEMMRPDYLRLLKILPSELPETIALQDESTDCNYFYYYAKLRDRRSYLEETNNYDRMLKERGAYIDIFPLEKQCLWVHILSEKTTGHMYKVWRNSTDDQKSMRQVKRIFNLNQHTIYPLLRRLNLLLGSQIVTSGLGIPFHNPRYEQDIFPLTVHDFEVTNYLSPTMQMVYCAVFMVITCNCPTLTIYIPI